MTTNKPEVNRYNITTDKYDYPVPYETEHGQWVKYSSYKALQTEFEKLGKDAERYRLAERKGWPEYLRQIHPTVEAATWGYGDGARYSSPGEAIDAAMVEAKS